MDNDRNIDSVLMNIQKTSGGVVALLTFSTRISFHILSFLYRLAKKGMVAGSLCDDLKTFTANTGGDFLTYNIPLSEKSVNAVMKLQKKQLELEHATNAFKKTSIRNEMKSIRETIPELKQLKSLNMDYCVLPKLNGSEHTIQVAVARKSDEHFKTWFLNHLNTQMRGGEKSAEALKVFTEGNYSVFNMPFEELEELAIMLSDFNTMGINYAILPDLNVGDGYTQIAIPNVETDKVKQWFGLWKEKMIAEGKETREMYSVDENAYTSTAELSPEAYVNKADAPYQEVQAEFENKSTAVPWKAPLADESNPRFLKLMQDKNYEKVTINVESLVENRKENAATKKLEGEGYFVSRFPYTRGNRQLSLVLPRENIFKTDNDKTVIAFLDKRKAYPVVSADGTVGDMNSEAILKKYDEATRRFKKVVDYEFKGPEVAAKTVEQAIDLIKPIKK